MAGVVRRDGLREAVTALRDKWVADEGRTWISNCGDELSAVLEAVPDVPPATPLANHIKAGMLRGRVRLSDVPPDPPAADRDELARVLAEHMTLAVVLAGNETWAWVCSCGQSGDGFSSSPLASATARDHLRDEIAGVLVDAADVRARAQEAAWDEGWSAARQVVREQKPGDNPYRSDRAVSEREGASDG